MSKSLRQRNEPTVADDQIARWLFEGFAPLVLKAMSEKPQRTRAIAEAAGLDRRDALWVLRSLTTGHVLVEGRGDWWRLTENGQKAMAGEPAPDRIAA